VLNVDMEEAEKENQADEQPNTMQKEGNDAQQPAQTFEVPDASVVNVKEGVGAVQQAPPEEVPYLAQVEERCKPGASHDPHKPAAAAATILKPSPLSSQSPRLQQSPLISPNTPMNNQPEHALQHSLALPNQAFISIPPSGQQNLPPQSSRGRKKALSNLALLRPHACPSQVCAVEAELPCDTSCQEVLGGYAC